MSGGIDFTVAANCMLDILMSRSNDQVHIDEINVKCHWKRNQKSFTFVIFCLFRIKQDCRE